MIQNNNNNNSNNNQKSFTKILTDKQPKGGERIQEIGVQSFFENIFQLMTNKNAIKSNAQLTPGASVHDFALYNVKNNFFAKNDDRSTSSSYPLCSSAVSNPKVKSEKGSSIRSSISSPFMTSESLNCSQFNRSLPRFRSISQDHLISKKKKFIDLEDDNRKSKKAKKNEEPIDVDLFINDMIITQNFKQFPKVKKEKKADEDEKREQFLNKTTHLLNDCTEEVMESNETFVSKLKQKQMEFNRSYNNIAIISDDESFTESCDSSLTNSTAKSDKSNQYLKVDGESSSSFDDCELSIDSNPN